MEEDQEHRFVCKICSKSCFSGKSLGGHMRGHLASISAKKHEDHQNGEKVLRVSDSTQKLEKLKNGDLGLEGDCHGSYGLRENPKKTWRVSNPKQSVAMKEKLCKECGKEFPSLRALSGHMRCHSIKDRENICKQCGKGFDSMRALFGHMRHHTKRSRLSNESPEESQSEYKTACPIRRKRSKTRYKVTGNFASSNLNSSSNVSEIDEVEEAAMCLIMLSRGVINWVEFNSVLESSENNSVIFEAKSVHQSEKLVSDVDETWKVKKLGVKFDSCVSYSGNSVFEKNESELGDFDSGFFSKNKKKAEFEVSIDGFHEGDKFKKPVVDDESEIKNGSEPTEVELEKGLMREVVLDQADSEILKSNSSKEAGFDVQEPELGAGFEVQDPELGEILCDEIYFVASTSGIFEDFQKKREYTCKTCNKIFHSYRALGGHRANHKTISSSENRTVEANISPLTNTEANSKLDKLECNENAVEHDIGLGAMTSYELKKSKDHKCPICFKVFPSGQALGGHKRAHYIGFSENRNTESVSTKQEELPDIHNSIFDLNVPLSLESEVNDDDVVVGFKPWLVGSDHEREPPLISNSAD
ncbi:unnamed protein product [Camellia sinensis]